MTDAEVDAWCADNVQVDYRPTSATRPAHYVMSFAHNGNPYALSFDASHGLNGIHAKVTRRQLALFYKKLGQEKTIRIILR